MKKKSWLLVSGVVLVAALGGWIIWSGAVQQTEDKIPSESAVIPVTPTTPAVKVPEISPSPTIPSTDQPNIGSEPTNTPSAPAVISEPKAEPTPSETPVLQPEKKKTTVKVPITKPKQEAKTPKEPAKPQVKETEKMDNPASPPKYEEKQTKPNKKTETEPKAGDKQNGKIYVPGFGWIEDQGGGTQEIKIDSDGDINKQVGSMD